MSLFGMETMTCPEVKPLVDMTSLRASLWMQVYVKSVDLENVDPTKEADAALKEFDERFPQMFTTAK